MAVTNVCRNFGRLNINKTNTHISLDRLTPEEFLQEHWQKKPLLVRNALPGFQGLLTKHELIQLAGNEESQSRLVINKNSEWIVKHGPLTQRDFTRLPKSNWSLLVQDVNHFLASAHDLLFKFSFIPHARLDDLMVSYAPAGGGIGPHFDSYDVFLLQGSGRRRWEIAASYDKKLIKGAPLKILQHFKADQIWVLEPGDMLYLPPNYAHHGTAVDECMTYSIGFKAPSYQELITHFLIYLQDNLEINGWYTDPELTLQPNPEEISHKMHLKVQSILKKIKWNAADTENFLGVYLTEPKTHIFFEQPTRPLSFNTFNTAIQKSSLQLNLKSRMLTSRNHIFLNGETYPVSPAAKKVLSKLIFRRNLIFQPNTDEEIIKILYQWYVNGYLLLTDRTQVE